MCVFCLFLFVVCCFVFPVKILHLISVSLHCEFPVVDRLCLALARQCRKKKSVGFTFSPSCLGTAVCCFLLCWLLGLLSFLSEPWYLGLLQLLHFLFTSKRSSDRQGHELDRVQRKKIANGFVFLPAAV